MIKKLQNFYFCTSRDFSNFSYLRHKNFGAIVVSMHQSGTHWLKYMLSMAIAHDKNLPFPEHIGDDMIISPGPKRMPKHITSPLICACHSIPNPLIKVSLSKKNNKHPKYIILVRDIRDALTSHFQKHGKIYQCSFSEYLSGDPLNKKFDKDIWWDIRFLNRWGELAEKYKEQIKVVKYEDLIGNTTEKLIEISNFIEIEFNDMDDSIAYAVSQSSKEKMAKKDLKINNLKVVNVSNKNREEWFNESLKFRFQQICKEYLRYDFSYNYDEW